MLCWESCSHIHEGMLSRHLASGIQERELNIRYTFECFWPVCDMRLNEVTWGVILDREGDRGLSWDIPVLNKCGA